MAIHHLHLHPEPFRLVQSGKKTVESRLLDEKRQKYAVGDTLVFLNRENEEETVKVRITKLHQSTTFNELFTQNDLVVSFSYSSPEDLLRNIKQYYSQEDQAKYGVVGIEFTKIR